MEARSRLWRHDVESWGIVTHGFLPAGATPTTLEEPVLVPARPVTYWASASEPVDVIILELQHLADLHRLLVHALAHLHGESVSELVLVVRRGCEPLLLDVAMPLFWRVRVSQQRVLVLMGVVCPVVGVVPYQRLVAVSQEVMR